MVGRGIFVTLGPSLSFTKRALILGIMIANGP